ncbi:hypothetical protein K0M31_013965 [Melipona bicolor]|uniref:Uncharacterized protein n=1 Tax=Melipona bicolor TaxID=60889 RepID=A0AA40G7V9_9HYME|nr:hypothetical protein K0M31_013965 [Melipona bicolor]
MVSASGPTGILAGRPSGSQCLQGSQTSQNGCATRNHNEKKNIETEENAKLRHESDLYIRPSWTDAAIALDQLEKCSSNWLFPLIECIKRCIKNMDWLDWISETCLIISVHFARATWLRAYLE